MHHHRDDVAARARRAADEDAFAGSNGEAILPRASAWTWADPFGADTPKARLKPSGHLNDVGFHAPARSIRRRRSRDRKREYSLPRHPSSRRVRGVAKRIRCMHGRGLRQAKTNVLDTLRRPFRGYRRIPCLFWRLALAESCLLSSLQRKTDEGSALRLFVWIVRNRTIKKGSGPASRALLCVSGPPRTEARLRSTARRKSISLAVYFIMDRVRRRGVRGGAIGRGLTAGSTDANRIDNFRTELRPGRKKLDRLADPIVRVWTVKCGDCFCVSLIEDKFQTFILEGNNWLFGAVAKLYEFNIRDSVGPCFMFQ